ncbi:hypothetical protein [Falsiroseomonas sp.]|uniref:hypothetical protein n=1 Tax=Falsiroseomonas sp. TaxID=2870721 RepID=UPI00271DA63B|nr:hypothetical protein [Falsiroseomonas sp.]MDO9499015.1 hypothetical protein [Falsiroseomonas sp.]
MAADASRIQQDQQRAAAHAALEPFIAHLAACAPHMVVEGGPGFVVARATITLPGGARLRFEGTLEIEA